MSPLFNAIDNFKKKVEIDEHFCICFLGHWVRYLWLADIQVFHFGVRPSWLYLGGVRFFLWPMYSTAKGGWGGGGGEEKKKNQGNLARWLRHYTATKWSGEASKRIDFCTLSLRRFAFLCGCQEDKYGGPPFSPFPLQIDSLLLLSSLIFIEKAHE